LKFRSRLALKAQWRAKHKEVLNVSAHLKLIPVQRSAHNEGATSVAPINTGVLVDQQVFPRAVAVTPEKSRAICFNAQTSWIEVRLCSLERAVFEDFSSTK
jgi:hypothetical protein